MYDTFCMLAVEELTDTPLSRRFWFSWFSISSPVRFPVELAWLDALIERFVLLYVNDGGTEIVRFGVACVMVSIEVAFSPLLSSAVMLFEPADRFPLNQIEVVFR